ncbi:MAG: Bax inhibitor-1/YccA family protein [Chitinophagales bacterium]
MEYTNQMSDMALPVSAGTDEQQAAFIKKTYSHVALAVLGFVMVEYVFLSTPFITNLALSLTQGWSWLIMLGIFMFATTMAEKWAMSSTDRNMQYAAFLLYIAAQAFIFIPLLYIAINVIGDSSIVFNAGMLTLALFSGLTAVVFFTGKDFSFLRNFITVGGMLAMGLIVLGILFGFSLGLFFSFAMVALAAASILYQTSNMIHVYSQDQYVAASLGLFASLMLMLWYVMQILMSFSGD